MSTNRSPEAIDALAAEYVLGTLQGPARRRFGAMIGADPAVAAAVRAWEGRLARLAADQPEVAPSPALWEKLARAAGVAIDFTAVPPPLEARRPARAPGWLDRLRDGLRALLAPLPAGALAAGLIAGFLLPQALQERDDTALPESYVGVLATADGRPGLIVASRRHGRSADLKQLTPATPAAGQTLFLWAIDAQGRAAPVGAVPHGKFVQAPLPGSAEQVFARAVELGVTVEAEGSTPAAPTLPWVYRGLCGKVWRTR